MLATLEILAGVVNPTSGTVFVEKPKNFVFQYPDHQVVMPTVEADVAFGLGKYQDMNQEEVKSRVIKASDAVGKRDYMQLGVIKAVKNLIRAKKGGDGTALWVTHRLEELEYADGAVYMENGRVVRHGDVATISDFFKVKQSSYIDQIGS